VRETFHNLPLRRIILFSTFSSKIRYLLKKNTLFNIKKSFFIALSCTKYCEYSYARSKNSELSDKHITGGNCLETQPV